MWVVSCLCTDGVIRVVRVYANERRQAESRGAYRVEAQFAVAVVNVIRCKRG